MKGFFTLFVIVVAMLMAACEGDKPTAPPSKDGGGFEVDITAVTRSTVTLSVTPLNYEDDYLCMVYDKEFVDDFRRDEYLVSTILQELSAEAYKQGKTLAEYMPTIVDKGAIAQTTFSGLNIDSEYYVVVFGVDATNDYSPSTSVVKVPFKTLAVDESVVTFDVECIVTNNNVVFDVEPSDDEILWYLFTVTKDQYNYYVTDEGGYQMSESYFFEYYFQQQINAYLEAGYSEQEVIDALIHKGHLQLSAKGLNANTEHYYLIAGLILDGEGIAINTAISKGSYTTKDAEQAELSFNIEVWDVKQLSANVRITPSNNKDRYCALIQPWDGVTPADEMMHRIVEQWGGWMDVMANDCGPVEHVGSNAFRLPAADTDYYVIAFGYSGGITTEAYMKTFRTLPGGSVEEVEFSISVSNISPYSFNMGISSSDPTIYYIPGACVKEQYDEAEFIKAEEDAFDYYFENSFDFNPSITVAEVLDQYYYNGSASVKVSGLMPDTEVMAYIYALDVHTGRVVKSFTFDAIAKTDTLGDSAPAIELVGYYSGDDEAGTIFNDAAKTKGRVITVVKYNNLDNLRSLFTTMVEGDCSNPNGRSDCELWSITDGYWNSCKIAEPYTYYLVDWNVVETALCYGVDYNGKMGTMGRLYTCPTAENKSDIEELRTLVDSLKTSKSNFILPPSVVVADAPTKGRATITAL